MKKTFILIAIFFIQNCYSFDLYTHLWISQQILNDILTNNTLTISTNSSSTKQIAIFNVIGKKVFSSSFAGLKKTINVSAIDSGIYILKVTEAGKIATKKLVIR